MGVLPSIKVSRYSLPRNRLISSCNRRTSSSDAALALSAAWGRIAGFIALAGDGSVIADAFEGFGIVAANALRLRAE
jgi:hypothetical protein